MAETTTTTLYIPTTTTTLYVPTTTTTPYVVPTTTTTLPYVVPTTTTTTPYVEPTTTTTTVYTFDCSQVQCVNFPVNKGHNIKCPGDITTRTEELCCEQYATCDTFLCGVDAINKPTVFCKGGLALTIQDCDADTCCAARATCDEFKDCKGASSGNKGKLVECAGLLDTCDAETCCEEEDTCFPGEAEVSVQDRSGVRLDAIEPGMSVLAEDGMEPILGMLHLHSETTATLVHAKVASA